jgi:ubiquinone/menaquinone biosynthesis C-methylase UbiE
MAEERLRGFSGEVAQYYSRFRRGYPPRVIDALFDVFGLNDEDVVIDLGCGTGQLTLPLASRVHAAIGVDPEPDMLELAAVAAKAEGAENVSWVRGFDSDLPAIAHEVPRRVGAVTVATAIHWMNDHELFSAARSVVRKGGGVAVITNGSPLWLQDTDWSRRLWTVLEEWTGREVRSSCGTDENARRGYRAGMETAGFAVRNVAIEYEAGLDLEGIIGGLLSAMPPLDVADPIRRERFAENVRRALRPRTRFTEHVSVDIHAGTI